MSFNSSTNKLLRNLLGFKELVVTHHDLLGRKGILHLWVKSHKNGACCPECDRRCTLVQRNSKPGKSARNSRTWRDIPAGGVSIALHYSPREIHCPTHGRRQENIPWAAAKSRTSLRLEFQLMRLCTVMPQSEAAAQLGIPTSTVADILHRLITRYRDGHKIRGLKNLGIDEISYKKGHRYLTIVYDLDRRHVVWIGVGKARDTIDRFFNEVMSRGQRGRVKTACCDMSKTYIGAIRDHLPNALLVLDRFHVIKALNEAVDEVRKEQYRALSKAERKELKGLRFIILKNKNKRTLKERKAIAEIERSQRRLFRATTLKDKLSHFWEYTYIGSAQKFLKRWCKSAKLSRIEPLRKFVRLIDAHWDGIVASLSGITNAVAEGLNRIIRMTKNRASGFRSTSNFANMIYLIVGDLDLPAQIQPINRPRQTKAIHHKSLFL